MMGRMPRTLAVLVAVPLLYAADPAPREWPVYGGGPEGIRHSTLKQINRANVNQLSMAWSYDAQDGPGGLQTSPIIVGGVLYANTPKSRVIALGRRQRETALEVRFRTRPARGEPRRHLLGRRRRPADLRRGGRLRLCARRRAPVKPIESFGNAGRIDLREDLGRDAAKQSVVLTTPGIIYKDLLIVGGRTSEGLPASPGDIRAYDVRTGKLRWSFHTIPHPGEFGYETWPKDAWTYIGSANNWPGMAVDQKRGIVFVPTGSAAADFYGANRVGDNLFANTLLALDANTGKRLWHFQGGQARYLGSRLSLAAEPGDRPRRTAGWWTPWRRPPSTGLSSCSTGRPASRCFPLNRGSIRPARCREKWPRKRSRCPPARRRSRGRY